MARLALIFGFLMILISPVSMFIAGHVATTALIPAGFGALLIVCGLLAKTPSLRMHAMHGAALVGLLAALGGLGMSLPKLIKGEPLGRPVATYSQLALGIIATVFVVLAVKSFIDARKARHSAA